MFPVVRWKPQQRLTEVSCSFSVIGLAHSEWQESNTSNTDGQIELCWWPLQGLSAWLALLCVSILEAVQPIQWKTQQEHIRISHVRGGSQYAHCLVSLSMCFGQSRKVCIDVCFVNVWLTLNAGGVHWIKNEAFQCCSQVIGLGCWDPDEMHWFWTRRCYTHVQLLKFRFRWCDDTQRTGSVCLLKTEHNSL